MNSSLRGSWPIAMNRPVTASVALLAGQVSRSLRPVILVVAEDSVTSLFHPNEIFGFANARSCMILEARSSSRRWIDRHGLGEAGEEGGLLHRRVAAADHRDVLLAEEEPVTGGTPGDAVAGQPLLAREAELAVPEPVAMITALAW